MSLSFAELNDDNIVLRCVIASSQEWCEQFLGGRWVFNPNEVMSARAAGVGYTYDVERNVFIAPQPFPSWVLNEESFIWVPPLPYPIDGGAYFWNEETGVWVEVEDEAV
jgi:hypothetical protein